MHATKYNILFTLYYLCYYIYIYCITVLVIVLVQENRILVYLIKLKLPNEKKNPEQNFNFFQNVKKKTYFFLKI